jgi:hypothetical protein
VADGDNRDFTDVAQWADEIADVLLACRPEISPRS